MSGICILTDSTAQFSQVNFPGQDRVVVVPFEIRTDRKLYNDGPQLKAADLPWGPNTNNSRLPRPQAPSAATFRKIYRELAQHYSEVVMILLSGQLSPAAAQAVEAGSNGNHPLSIHVIDSQNTSAGLGWLVQAAAQAAEAGASAPEICRLVSSLIPRIYTVFCLQSLSYLEHIHQLDPAQARVGEMLGVAPFFALENGRLVSTQKAQSGHQMQELFHEFIAEFKAVRHIAVIEGIIPFTHSGESGAHSLRERLKRSCSQASWSLHPMGAALATMLGPRSLGLVAFEK